MEVKNQLRIVVTLAILACLPLQVLSRSSAQGKKPVTKEPITQKGLLDALHIGGLSPKALIQEIRSRGVAFELTPQLEVELRAAGAKPSVIDAVRANHRPLVGTLNVTTNVPGAIISVAGVGRFNDRITALKLPPAHYEISSVKLGYRPDSKGVDIRFAETANLELRLDPMAPDELLKVAKESYEQKNYQLSIALTRLILTKQSDQPKAITLLASSLYLHGDYDESITYFTKAMSFAEGAVIPVMHKHGGSWSGKSLCAGRITLTRDSIEFYSVDFPDEGFRIPYTKVIESSVKEQIRLFLKVRIKLPKNKKESEEEYNLYSTDAVATGRIVTCPECLNRMRVILELIRQARSVG